jgi:hypothetical protein
MLHLPIQFDDLLKIVDQLSDEQKHILSMRLADELTVGKKPKKPRVLGLHPGAFQPSDDFDDPLPDEFWLGEDV